MRKLLLIGLCAILLGTAAAPALAGTPSQGAYGGNGNNQLSKVQSNTATKTTTSTLPFTGLNVPVMAGIAVVLLGAGLTLRTRTRTDS